jgi:hypothetical protein
LRITVRDGMNTTRLLIVEALPAGMHPRRAPIVLQPVEGGSPWFLDENHAAALVLALQAAIAEVQARAVSL